MSEPALAMIEAVRVTCPDNKVPWCVHCSAGIGRTGTMIALDHGMHLLRNTGLANTLEIIGKLRKCRGGMVQHPVQAEFVDQCLTRYASSHGSIHELAVLEDSMNRALQAVPKGFKMHASQIDVDEGDTSSIPSWRVKELETRQKEASETLKDELDEARGKGAHHLADRKAARAAAKKKAKDAAAGAAIAMLENTDGTIPHPTQHTRPHTQPLVPRHSSSPVWPLRVWLDSMQCTWVGALMHWCNTCSLTNVCT